MKHRSRPGFERNLTVGIAFFLVSILVGGTAAAGDVDCSEQLNPIPRDGTTVEVANLWLSYSGSIVYGGVATAEDVELSGPGEPTIRRDSLEAASQVGFFAEFEQAGQYTWKIGDGPEASFDVTENAEEDRQAPAMSDGEVEASLELVVYDEFPVIFREWSVRFPAGRDERTPAEQMRYLLEFSWVDDEEGDEQTAVLVTPDLENASGDRVTVQLGGRADRCRHDEPGVALTEEVEIFVSAVDLAGNLSEEPAVGVFSGVSDEALAKAHDEMQVVIENLRQASIEERERRQREEEKQAQDEAEQASGCAITGSGGSLPAVLLVWVVALGLIRKR